MAQVKVDLGQPALGTAATLLVIAVSLGFISLFDWPTFAGWVSFLLMCTIPMTLVIAMTWQGAHPAFAARRRQPVRGAVFLLLAAAVGSLVGVVHFFTVGGGFGPPLPMLVQCIITSVVVAFFMCIVWGGWPFTLIGNRIVAGLCLVAGCYVVNYLLFRIFFEYSFLRGSPLYHDELDPHGLFDGWDATVFSVTCLGVMFLLLHFDLWPFTRFPAIMRQPVLGLVWTTVSLVLGAGVFVLATRGFGVAAPVFLIKGPIPFIFGTILLLTMLRGSLFAKLSQPAKGACSALAAAAIGTVLAAGYGQLAPTLTGTVLSGPPAYDYEVWVASALLAVTFPFLAYYADLFQMWPFAHAAPSPAHEDG